MRILFVVLMTQTVAAQALAIDFNKISKSQKPAPVAPVKEEVLAVPAKGRLNDGTITTYRISEEKAAPKRKIPMRATSQGSLSTRVLTHSIRDGARTNYATFVPGLEADIDEALTVYGNVPFTWTTDLDEKNNMREIGRPEFGALSSFRINENLIVGPTFSLKAPLYDNSLGAGSFIVGQAELYRVWRFSPGFHVDTRLNNSTFHAFAAVNASYDTEAKAQVDIFGSTADFLIIRPWTVRGTLGVANRLDKVTLGGALHTINGLEPGYFKLTNNPDMENELKEEFNGADLSSIEIFGSARVSKDTSINASIIKGLKNVDEANNRSARFVTFDSPFEAANLGVSVGLTQAF